MNGGAWSPVIQRYGLEKLLAALRDHGLLTVRTEGGWLAECPSCGRLSLEIQRGQGGWRFRCREDEQ